MKPNLIAPGGFVSHGGLLSGRIGCGRRTAPTEAEATKQAIFLCLSSRMQTPKYHDWAGRLIDSNLDSGA